MAISLVMLCPTIGYAQLSIEDQMAKVGIIIIYSTKEFEVAKEVAVTAAELMSDSLNVLAMASDFDEPVKCGCGMDHQRRPRGQYDDGDYISVERGSDRPEFTNGYYLVIAGSGHNSSGELDNRLEYAKGFYPDAYIKSIKVYMGCMH